GTLLRCAILRCRDIPRFCIFSPSISSLTYSSSFSFYSSAHPRHPPSCPTRRSSDLLDIPRDRKLELIEEFARDFTVLSEVGSKRSEEHTSELQSRFDLVCRLLLEKKKTEMSRAARAAAPVSLLAKDVAGSPDRVQQP